MIEKFKGEMVSSPQVLGRIDRADKALFGSWGQPGELVRFVQLLPDNQVEMFEVTLVEVVLRPEQWPNAISTVFAVQAETDPNIWYLHRCSLAIWPVREDGIKHASASQQTQQLADLMRERGLVPTPGYYHIAELYQ